MHTPQYSDFFKLLMDLRFLFICAQNHVNKTHDQPYYRRFLFNDGCL